MCCWLLVVAPAVVAPAVVDPALQISACWLHSQRKPSRKTRTNHLYMKSFKCSHSPPTSSPWTRRPLLTAQGRGAETTPNDWYHTSDSRKPRGGVHQSLPRHVAAWQLANWGWMWVCAVWPGQFCSQRFRSWHGRRRSLCSMQIHAYTVRWGLVGVVVGIGGVQLNSLAT